MQRGDVGPPRLHEGTKSLPRKRAVLAAVHLDTVRPLSRELRERLPLLLRQTRLLPPAPLRQLLLSSTRLSAPGALALTAVGAATVGMQRIFGHQSPPGLGEGRCRAAPSERRSPARQSARRAPPRSPQARRDPRGPPRGGGEMRRTPPTSSALPSVQSSRSCSSFRWSPEGTKTSRGVAPHPTPGACAPRPAGSPQTPPDTPRGLGPGSVTLRPLCHRIGDRHVDEGAHHHLANAPP